MIVVFGIVGYLFERFKFPIAPMVLGCILGPQTENAFMISMISYQGDWTVYFTRPIAGAIMVLSLLALIYPLFRTIRHRRRIARLNAAPAR